MAFNYNIEEVPPADLPCVEHDIRRAKKFLQKHSPESGDSLYDHLTDVLNKILAERPKNAVDIFEQYSRQLKEERFRSRKDHLRDLYVPPAQYEDAKKLIELFRQPVQTSENGEEDPAGDDEEDETKRRKPNMLDLLYYFEQTGVGLPRAEMVILNLSIRKLMADNPIENVRFWGKILGRPKNYWVVEADLQEEEINRRIEVTEAAEQTMREIDVSETVNENQDDAEKEAANAVLATDMESNDPAVEEKHLVLNFPPLPEGHWKPPPEIPSERIGTGVNKKTYFVSTSPGLDDWVELPTVTAQQIIAARLMVRCFTGNLETPIYTFPAFPGTEKNYLRAQIARITAATSISPIGWYNFGGDEEEEIGEEEEGLGGNISENPHYDPLSLKDLIDPSMSNWCHHRQHILKQGRTTWWNPNAPEEDEEEFAEEEDNEDDEGAPEAQQKEVGPPLLTPLSEDASLDTIPAWTVRQSSLVQPDFAVAIVRSNLWPGAFAFATGKRFANLYIGWGHKFTVYNYTPPSMPLVQDQYKIGPEVMEVQDPTFEMEEEWRIAHLPAPELPPMGEEEELLGEASPDEDEEDEDED
ncbi:radial spoke head protein 6 homolog A [Neodiprion virginianus]|uniref:radial spoke head protein 6 homolog A n=1 Tax=Neodiprion virginianus TaxID=2961670 RepID=UPI001EE76B0A|nr:radial spoke head protein 6 homolog A [Neodiprion virginianus]